MRRGDLPFVFSLPPTFYGVGHFIQRKNSVGKIIAIANQKGGVAKTTTCVNLAAALTAAHRRVLLVDLDPQSNATVGSGVSKNLEKTVQGVLLGEIAVEDAILPASADYDILPASPDLTVAEVRLLQQHAGRESSLRNSMQRIRDQYDFILIDCPPALNILTVNALVAADSVLIPMPCEYFALEGLAGLLKTIEEISHTANPHLTIEGVLRTMYDGRNRLTHEVTAQLVEHFGGKLYTTVIPRNVRVAEAPSFGLPVLQYDPRSQGAIAYVALAGEVLSRHKVALGA
jgi:chromosome partitioning protein